MALGYFSQAGWPQSQPISSSLEPASLQSWLQYFSLAGAMHRQGKWAHFADFVSAILNSCQEVLEARSRRNCGFPNARLDAGFGKEVLITYEARRDSRGFSLCLEKPAT